MKILHLHFRSISLAIKKIFLHPFEHLLNILVIALITSMLGAILVISQMNNKWQQNNVIYPQIMVYLNKNATAKDVSKLEITINNFKHNSIKNYQYISKEDGLKELQQDKQLQNIASSIGSDKDNPLPNILIINTLTTDPNILTLLNEKIANLPFVDSVEMDKKYASKINNLLNLVKNISNLLLIFFGVSLVLIIYNLIRLQMLQRNNEINVSRLIGASDTYVMRPLAYYAVIQILIGSSVSFLLVNSFINYLNNLFIELNSLFGKTFIIDSLSSVQLSQILLTLVIFTLFAVFIAIKTVFRKGYTQ